MNSVNNNYNYPKITDKQVEITYSAYREFFNATTCTSDSHTLLECMENLKDRVNKCATNPGALSYLKITSSLDKVGTPEIQDIISDKFIEIDKECGYIRPYGLVLKNLYGMEEFQRSIRKQEDEHRKLLNPTTYEKEDRYTSFQAGKISNEQKWKA
ncbi:MAG: hypothetical protein V4489_09905 [Chlamydiota bacterium]